mmetsp:Transcript_8692/g.22372  ORF Transcript_8692/g.22372 Transcript_8692/m.22372 type:complete len:278 (+) Transcript_8692:3-836(+)
MGFLRSWNARSMGFLSIWKAVMVGISSGFRSTSNSSSLPGLFSPFHRLRMEGGSCRMLFEIMRIFSKSLHWPIELGSFCSSLKERNSTCNFAITNLSGIALILLCDRSSSTKFLHRVMLSGTACRRLLDRSRCLRLLLLSAITPKSGGSRLNWLLFRTSTSRLPKARFEKMPAWMPDILFHSRTSVWSSLHLAKLAENALMLLCAISSFCRFSSSSSELGRSSWPQRLITMVCRSRCWFTVRIMASVMFLLPSTRSSSTCAVVSWPRTLTFTFTLLM